MSSLKRLRPPIAPSSSSATPTGRRGDSLRHELSIAETFSFEDLVALLIGPSSPQQVVRVHVSME